MKRYRALVEYEVHLSIPEPNEDKPVTQEDFDFGWSQCEGDAIYVAVESSHGGDVDGFIEWGLDESDGWMCSNMNEATTDVVVRYGTVEYEVQEISWNHEGI